MRIWSTALIVASITASGADAEGDHPWMFDEGEPAQTETDETVEVNNDGDEVADVVEPDEPVEESCEPSLELTY